MQFPEGFQAVMTEYWQQSLQGFAFVETFTSTISAEKPSSLRQPRGVVCGTLPITDWLNASGSAAAALSHRADLPTRMCGGPSPA